MADGTDDLEELEAELDATEDFQDEEASAALSEAQSVIDDAKSTAGGDLDLGGDTGQAAASDADADTDSEADSGSGLLPSLSLPSLSLPSPSVPSPGELFSTRFYVVAVVGAVLGAIGGGLVPIVDSIVGGLLAFAGVSFLLGLVASERHYLETTLAGLSVFGVLVALSELTNIVREGLSSGVRVLGFVAAGVVVAAVVGTYLGRDVRKGILGSPDDADPSTDTGTDDLDL